MLRKQSILEIKQAKSGLEHCSIYHQLSSNGRIHFQTNECLMKSVFECNFPHGGELYCSPRFNNQYLIMCLVIYVLQCSVQERSVVLADCIKSCNSAYRSKLFR